MNWFFDKLFEFSDITSSIGVTDVVIAMTLSLLLSLALSETYRHTHRSTTYSHQLLLTMIVMSVATSVIMLIIGSNIARAFSLVGALSVIRFRTPVKDSKDTAYIFMAMVIGMGSGTAFYIPTALFTAFMIVILWLAHRFNYGSRFLVTRLLKIEASSEASGDSIESLIKNYFREVKLINQTVLGSSNDKFLVYSVLPKDKKEISKELPPELNEKLRSEHQVKTLSLSSYHEPSVF